MPVAASAKSMPRFAAALPLILYSFLGGRLAPHAHAQAAAGPKTVVMLVDGRVLPLARRLEQEIESLGIRVKTVTAAAQVGSSVDRSSFDGAVAVIRLSPLGGDDVDMSIFAGASGESVRYQLVSSNGKDTASELVATRAVELLRATLLELDARNPSPTTPPVAPLPRKELEKLTGMQQRGSPSSLSLSFGPAAFYTTSFRPGLSLQGTVTWLPLPRFGVGASALAPLAPPRTDSGRGIVTLDADLFRLDGVVALGKDASPVSFRGSAGVELDVLRFEGQALEPYRSAVDRRTSWSIVVGVAPRFRIADNLHVVWEVVMAWAVARTGVRVGGEEIARFGRPSGSASLALELTWFGRRHEP